MSTCAVIIVAAGTSRRAGFDKLTAPLRGISVLYRSILAFARCRAVAEIVVVCPRERYEAIVTGDMVEGTPVSRVDGGDERHLSVQNGLASLQTLPEFVAVHDGARPLISGEQITKCLEAAVRYGAAASARPVTDTLMRADDDGLTLPEPVNRDGLWAMETPQIFRYSLLLDAYIRVAEEGIPVTDEVSALRLIGHPTKLVKNNSPNIKITWPEDIEKAESLMDLAKLN